MTDPTEIPPALTPEEWAHLLSPPPDDYPDADAAWIAGQVRSTASYHVDYGRLHKAAALCLHEQPFGFTQADVAMLLRDADAADEGNAPTSDDMQCTINADAYRALAARIAALLPPTS